MTWKGEDMQWIDKVSILVMQFSQAFLFFFILTH